MKFVCIGNCAYDITFMLDDFPKENFKYKVNDVYECSGGSCCNAAALLSKWGMDTFFIGTIGNDDYGKKIKSELLSIGVNTSYLNIQENYKTTVSNIIVNKKNGSRTILSYHPCESSIDNVDLNFVPDIILVDGREYNISKKIIEKYPNAISIIDAGNVIDDVINLCKICDYVVCSKDFMERVSNIPLNDLSNISTAFNILEEKFNSNIIVTLEEKGCAYRQGSEVVIVPSITVKSVDTTGAGDIFHGAFAYGLSKKWSLDKILKFSNIAGALSVTKIGGKNSIFSFEEVERVYNETK